MTWLGWLILGMVIGACLGIGVFAMCVAADQADRDEGSK